MANAGKTVNKLTALNTVKFYNWLTEGDRLSKGASFDSVGLTATSELGFEVNGNNVWKAMQDLGLKFPSAKPDIDGRINIIKRQVEILCGQLGVQLSPEWTDL